MFLLKTHAMAGDGIAVCGDIQRVEDGHMIYGIKRSFGKAVLAAGMALTMAIPAASTALAQDSLVQDPPHYEEIPGCDQNVYNAIKYVGQVNALRDVQLAEETLIKPESVFRMTCFALDIGPNTAGDQVANAGRTINGNDRFLWRQTNSDSTGGWAGHHSERADEKVRNWTRNQWLNNYARNLIDDEVAEDCASLQNTWSFLTGNGAKRWLTDQQGNPDPNGSDTAGCAGDCRQDDAFFVSTSDIWNGNDSTGANTTDSVPNNAWSIQDQTTSVIESLADAAINQLEDDQFNRTDPIQVDIIDIGYLDFTCTEFAGPAPGCTGYADPTDCHGQECLIGQNVLDLFNNL